MNIRWLLTCILWIIASNFFAQVHIHENVDSIKIISYNVENLFDCQHDTLKNDSAFLEEGMYHWHYSRYQNKLEKIAQVVVNISGWESAPLVGLCEIENEHCLKDLCYHLKRFHYKFIHYESPDERGIDVALLYDSTKINILTSEALYVDLQESFTRDILYASCLVNFCDTIHTFVCHLPSQSSGSHESDWKRKYVKNILQNKIDSIQQIQPEAKIVIMGDMNTNPINDLKGMNNLMIDLENQGEGTHKYHGIWSCLDQFYVSNHFTNQVSASIFSADWLLEEDTKYLGVKPFRTYIGYTYHNGYSDHLPIVLTIKL